MAMFEQKIPRKVCLDDTEILSANIKVAQNVNGHIEYIIKVQRGSQHHKSWFVSKRYNDFVALHSILRVSGVNLSLPPKKLMGNLDWNFIAERQLALQNYLNVILMNPILASSLGVKKFLDPQNYSVPLQEQALQHVSMALRSEINYELIKALPEMGWRIRKHYFLVNGKNSDKAEMLLQWVDYGPDKCLKDNALHSVLKCLLNLNHPYIEKLEFLHFGEGGCFVIRQFYPSGSLRDLIYCTKPKNSYLKKYGNPKQVKSLTASEISLYGSQILEALIFLRDRGIPYGHLHLGNILLVDNKIRLLDIENSFLGFPSYYRPYFLQHKKIKTMEAIDVYSFGHVLFEMAFGYPLHESLLDIIPPSCPVPLRTVLESILSPESCRTGMPSLEDLIRHPFFSASARTEPIRAPFKVTNTVKESFEAVIQNIEGRLKEEQKTLRHQKKVAKMLEILGSNGEIKKGKSKAVLREGAAARKQQNSTNVEPNNINKSSPRSESPTSTSTATSAGTVTPPLSGPGGFEQHVQA